MKISILTTGTRGDVQPFVAIGAALRARGHEVTTTAPLDLLALVEAGDMRAVPMPFSAQEILNSDLGQTFLANGDVVAFARALRDLDAMHRPALVDACLAASADADLVFAHPLLLGPAIAIAHAKKIPMLRGYLGPTQSTREMPTPLLNLPSMGPINLVTHAIVNVVLGRVSAETARGVAARLGVPAPRGNLLSHAEKARSLTLHLYSAALQPRPRDWPAHHVITGMITLDAATRARLGEKAPPAGLDAWLAAGAAPVFFGFGSMPVGDPARMLALVDEVCVALDVRGLVGAAWSGLAPTSDPSTRVFVAPSFDHDAYLPRCRAAVHHGGAGTTHAVVRAGLPAVVCHFLVDQPYWGRRLGALGIGSRTPFHKLTAKKLTDALRPLLDPAVKKRAEELGAQIAAEDGLAAALGHFPNAR